MNQYKMEWPLWYRERDSWYVHFEVSLFLPSPPLSSPLTFSAPTSLSNNNNKKNRTDLKTFLRYCLCCGLLQPDCCSFFFSNQTNLSAMQEDLLATLEHKNPSVKEETIRFLVRCFSKSTPAALPKTFLKPVCSSLLKVRA